MRIATRLKEEQGFTLIEVLVVLVIIGILAAIALMSLTKEQAKAQDAEAKSNARSIVSVVEACATAEEDYRQCESDDVPGIRDAGIALGGAPGQVVVTSNQRLSYLIVSRSQSGNVFRMRRTNGGVVDRTCTVAAGNQQGGCSGSPNGTW